MPNLSKNKSLDFKFENKIILHTSPHPDDVTLGYLPYINWLLNNFENNHNFLIMTSGANAVRNSNLEDVLYKIKFNLLNNKNNNLLETKLLRNLLNNVDNLNNFVLTKIDKLLENLKQNNIDSDIEFLKGIIREFEEESVWCSLGISNDKIYAFRANFYQAKTDNLSQDIENFYEILLKLKPDIITVAIDPKTKAPLTHYKTFVVIQRALKLFYEKTNKDLVIIGYRNVWHQFLLQEANIFFPVNVQDFDLLKNIFLNCYKTQINAMFPNSNHVGNFVEISIKIMKQNLVNFNNKFKNNISDKNICGLCLLKQMNIKEFINLSLDY